MLNSEASYSALYDFLLGQAGVEPRPVGTLKTRERRHGNPLRFGDESKGAPAAPAVDISRIVKYAPDKLIGRETETKLLFDAWEKAVRGETKRPHVLTFVGLGGEGKTSLVAKGAAELAHQDWPGCEAVFAWSFYSQGTRQQMAASSDLFLKEALTVFGDRAMAESAESAFDKGRRLAQLVGERRSLLILDGLEPLQYPPVPPMDGKLKDDGIAALLKGLAATNSGLCVVTTRYSIPDLKTFWQTTAPEVKLTRLSKEAGVALLRSLGVKGAQKEFELLVEEVKGHALTLNLLGTFLRDAYAGDIRKRDLVKLEEADAEEQGGHAFRVMDAYVKSFESEGEKGKRALAVLRLQGLFDRPTTADCLAALQKAPAIPGLTEALVGMSEAQRNAVFTRLEAATLLTVNRDAAGTLVALDAHPLLREYFARQFRTQHPEAWRAAHRRLYEHLCATTKDKPQPTLEDLQPLYQAVAHGCQAGLQQETHDKVWLRRIRQGNDYYSTRKLGAFGSDLGAVACFFESPWKVVSPSLKENDRAALLNTAASWLLSLGRLTEAIEPMRAATNWATNKMDWRHAAVGAGNLSELDLMLGDVAGALVGAKQSVTYANKSDNVFQQIGKRAVLGNALHQAGCPTEAEECFKEAEELQAKSRPEYGILYSTPGFKYCDLLLSAAERAAWQTILQPGTRNTELKTVAACWRAVSERAVQTLKWVERAKQDILSIALDHLTLGRVAFYEALVEKFEIKNAKSEVEKAVEGLRHAGQIQELPRGLLTLARLRYFTGARTGAESAEEALEEAWEIAERGPMRLHMADVYLHRARLFFRDANYLWESPQKDLEEARKLIEQCGYWRRKDELEDAELAILGKSRSSESE